MVVFGKVFCTDLKKHPRNLSSYLIRVFPRLTNLIENIKEETVEKWLFFWSGMNVQE